MITGKQQRRRNPVVSTQATPPMPPNASVLSVVVSGANVIVTFDGPVSVQSTQLPTSWRFGTSLRTVTSYVTITASALTLALSGSVAAAQPYMIQSMDPAIRTTYGGYVTGSTGAMG